MIRKISLLGILRIFFAPNQFSSHAFFVLKLKFTNRQRYLGTGVRWGGDQAKADCVHEKLSELRVLAVMMVVTMVIIVIMMNRRLWWR